MRRWILVPAFLVAVACTDSSAPPVASLLAFTTAPSGTVANRTTLAVQPVVQLRDADGNDVSAKDVVVTASIASGEGSLLNATAVTDANGTATFSGLAFAAAAGPKTISFSADNFPSIAADVVVSSGPAFSVEAVRGDGQSTLIGRPVAIPPAVRVTDQDGNAVSGVTVSFGADNGGSTIGATGESDASGAVAVGSWTLGIPAGPNTLTASFAGMTTAPATFTATGIRIVSVAVGDAHWCALASSGKAYCWGTNANGQLGNNSTTASSVPVPVAGGHSFTALTAGASFTCGLGAAGAAYCWGNNTSGQLGDNTTTEHHAPVSVAGGLAFSSISAGNAHVCGLSGSTAYCWGDNSPAGPATIEPAGELGDGTTTDRYVPTPVSGGLSFAVLSAGEVHTCGLTTTGAAYCWGDDHASQLGIGTVVFGPQHWSTVPVAVQGGHTFSSLEAGRRYPGGQRSGLTCAREGSTTYCWGGGVQSDFSTQESSPSVPVAITAPTTFIKMDPSCFLDADGSPYCVNSATGLTAVASPQPLDVIATGPKNCGVSRMGWVFCWSPGVTPTLVDWQ